MINDDVICAFREAQVSIARGHYLYGVEMERACERLIKYLKSEDFGLFDALLHELSIDKPDQWDAILDLVFADLKIDTREQFDALLRG